MTVTGREIHEGQPRPVAQPVERPQPAVTVQPRTRTTTSRVVALFAFAIGLPFWLDGARYTRDGWIAFLNWLAMRLSIPAQVPPLSWQVALGAMIAMGAAYSYIEMGRQPFTVPSRAQFFSLSAWRMERSWQAWLVWIVLIVSDIGTTYAGIRQARPDELAVLQSIGQSVRLAVVYGVVITFVPDRLLRYGWRGFWGKSG